MAVAGPQIDPITLEVVNNKLNGIVQEMQNLIFRTGYSTIIRESKDASAAITDEEGRLVGQAVQHPLHTGVFTPSVQALFQAYPLAEIQEGDVFLVNDPYVGGSPHTSDMIVMTPVFYKDQLVSFCCNAAHKPDIGGMVPGTASGGSREIFHEGLLLPVVKYHHRGQVIREVERIIGNNSRIPDLILGDLRGQVGCTRVGTRRLVELMDKYGVETIRACFREVIARTAKRIKDELSRWPNGTQEAEGFLDDDGVDINETKRVHVAVTVSGEEILFDFTQSCPQAKGPVNIRPHVVKAACQYALVAMIDPHIPCNHGLYQVAELRLKEGTIVNPIYPAPLSTYSPLLQLTANVVLHALGKFFPHHVIAGNGIGCAMGIGGLSTKAGQAYVFYEILNSAIGGRRGKDGVSGITEDISNCSITPIEAIETEFPIRVERFEWIQDSGGPGQYRGGLSFRRDYRVLNAARFTFRGDRHKVPAWGVVGGKEGRPGACILSPGTPSEKRLRSKFAELSLEPNDIIRIEMPGAGGYGPPGERDPQLVLEDVKNGFVSVQSAEKDYLVVIDPREMKVDEEKTERLRRAAAF